MILKLLSIKHRMKRNNILARDIIIHQKVLILEYLDLIIITAEKVDRETREKPKKIFEK